MSIEKVTLFLTVDLSFETLRGVAHWSIESQIKDLPISKAPTDVSLILRFDIASASFVTSRTMLMVQCTRRVFEVVFGLYHR